MRRLGGGLHLFLADDVVKDKNIMIMLRSIIREFATKDDIKVLRSELEALMEEVGARI
jgi:hypothetical protein